MYYYYSVDGEISFIETEDLIPGNAEQLTKKKAKQLFEKQKKELPDEAKNDMAFPEYFDPIKEFTNED